VHTIAGRQRRSTATRTGLPLSSVAVASQRPARQIARVGPSGQASAPQVRLG
jgi:hypothetical protein